MKRTKQQNQKFNQGITLVALVVTIVVLLILSSVSLNLVLGDNGIIVKAKEAAETTAAAQEKEAMERNLLEKELENSLSTPAVEPTDGVKIPTGFYYVGGTKASGKILDIFAGNPGGVAVYPLHGAPNAFNSLHHHIGITDIRDVFY